MNTNSFKPLHEAHAIERVFFVVEFNQLIPEPKYIQLKDIREEFKEELPKYSEIKNLGFSIGGQIPAGTSPIMPKGFILQGMAKDGSLESELRIEQNLIGFRTDFYTRWKEVWSKAKVYFDRLIPEYCELTSIRSISLNYSDKFIKNSQENDSSPFDILRKNSDYLCPHIYNINELWHSHTGKYINIDNKVKRLLNVNVDYLDEVQANNPPLTREIISISTVLTDLFNQPGYDKIEISKENAIDIVDDAMNDMHIYGKNIFSQIINDDFCKRISLNADK